MKLRKILMPTDFSSMSKEPIELAASLAREHGATLIIAHAEEPAHVYLTCDSFVDLPEPSPAAVEQLLRTIVPEGDGIRVEHRLLKGLPSHAIVDLAKSEAVDLIIIATHGRSGMRRFLMGSVAETIVRLAPCPVFVYKPRLERKRDDQDAEDGQASDMRQ